MIVLTVSSTNDYLKDGQFIKLNQQTNLHNIHIIRDDIEKEMPSKNLLVGDLMFISPGEILPADGILARGNGLSIDESTITGESNAVKRQIIRAGDPDSNPFLISGGKVIEGNGMMIVCSVGLNSVIERNRLLAGLVEENDTPLQERLSDLAETIGKFGIIAGGILTTVLLIHIAINAIIENSWSSDDLKDVVTSIILGITIIVVAIPEGLPLALTVAMAYSIFRMKEENIFVRHLKGCEIMGAATNILSDKTGTLTQNKMKAAKAVFYDQNFENLEQITLN